MPSAQDLHLRNSSFSPDIYGLQVFWDSTSLGTLKECPRKYYYSLVLGWSPRETSVHLIFGQVYHAALEAYDHAKTWGCEHEQATHFAVYKALILTWDFPKGRPWLSDDPNKNRATLVRSVIWYLEQFGKNDNVETITLANGKPAVELSFRFATTHLSPSGEPYFVCGHLDRLGVFQDQAYILDRKTTKTTISADFFTKYSPDNQFQIYSLAGELVYNVPTRGIIVDAAQIAVTFSRFARGFVNYTVTQSEEFYSELGDWFSIAAAYATAGRWPKNEKACGNYGGCSFRMICSKPPSLRDDWLQAAFFQRNWNPLQVRGDI